MKLKHKFRAKPTEVDDIKFPSKKEAAEYQKCKLEIASGELLFFFRQVPIHLPGGVKYVLDFLKFWANGTVTLVEVKGHKTDLYIAKKKLVEALYPFEIQEV